MQPTVASGRIPSSPTGGSAASLVDAYVGHLFAKEDDSKDLRLRLAYRCAARTPFAFATLLLALHDGQSLEAILSSLPSSLSAFGNTSSIYLLVGIWQFDLDLPAFGQDHAQGERVSGKRSALRRATSGVSDE